MDEDMTMSEVLSTTKSFSSIPYWQAIYDVIHNRICQWYEIENQIPTPRTAEDEEQIDLEPDQLTLITQQQRTMTQARGDSLLPTENHETMIRKSFRTVSICQNCGEWTNSTSPMNLLWTETVLLLYAETPRNQEILKVRDFQAAL